MKLPVKQILSKNRKHYQIIDSNKEVIVTDIHRITDAMIIEDSLNNYPTCLKLLKDLVQTIEWQENFLVEDAEENENDYKLAKEFLNQI